jgi:hypothetical protein
MGNEFVAADEKLAVIEMETASPAGVTTPGSRAAAWGSARCRSRSGSGMTPSMTFDNIWEKMGKQLKERGG